MAIELCEVGDPRLAKAGPLPALLEGARGLVGDAGDARLVYWLAEDLVPGPVGIVGCVEARGHVAGLELLDEVARRLRAAGARRILGPMQGSSWGEYRLVLPDPALDAPPFIGEPPDRPDLLALFRAAGYRTAAAYQSRSTELPARRAGAERLRRRLELRGIEVRAPASCELPGLARRLFELSREAFAENLFYRPVSFEAFIALQCPVRRAPVVLLAERDGVLLGFAYAYQDTADSGRLVAKTLAVRPDARFLGLGAHLADRLHDLAASAGFRRVVHALMHEGNASLRHSERFGGTLLRRYVLLRRDLP